MRLIDADKLIKKIDRYTRTNNVEFNIVCKYIIEVVKEQPTAFDVDKVVEQLEELKEWEDVDGKAYYTMSEKQVINKAIKIVRRGGIDEQ